MSAEVGVLATAGAGETLARWPCGAAVTMLIGIGILVSFFTALSSKTLELQAERRRARAQPD
jgi:hypothetical protein